MLSYFDVINMMVLSLLIKKKKKETKDPGDLVKNYGTKGSTMFQIPSV